ncbi:MAG: glycosyltransferase [Planctomycetota bacterium]
MALAHDWLVGYRGGEAVLERIAALPHRRPDLAVTMSSIHTMFAKPNAMRDAAPNIHALPTHTSPLNAAPAARRWLLPLYPFAVERLARSLARQHEREPIDLLVSTSSAAIKGLRPPTGVPHLCYCHSPARYLWDRTTDYAGHSATARLRGLGLRALGPALRHWDRNSAQHVTHFLANSTHTADLIRHAYHRDADIVYPPVRTSFFTPPPASDERDDAWLLVSALEPYKRTDLAILAAIEAGARLRIVGEGSQRAELESLAAQADDDQITFLGRVNDEQLRSHYQRARLLVFPQIEDFGIVAVEAQAAGLPVLARAKGGALDTVIDNETGALFDDPSPKAIAAAAQRIPERADHDCALNAAQFSESVFDQAIADHIQRAIRVG